MNTLDYHVLLALANGQLHGYAIKDAIARECGATRARRPGPRYRGRASLMATGRVAEAKRAGEPSPHPGLARRYYALSAAGRRALAEEARRLRGAAALAEER